MGWAFFDPYNKDFFTFGAPDFFLSPLLASNVMFDTYAGLAQSATNFSQFIGQ